MSETDQLRQVRSYRLLGCPFKHFPQELKILEDSVEQSLLKQEAALDTGDHSSVLSSDLQTKYEVRCGLRRNYS